MVSVKKKTYKALQSGSLDGQRRSLPDEDIKGVFKLAPTIPLKKHLKFSLGSMVNNAKENTYKHIKPLCIEHDFFFGLNQR